MGLDRRLAERQLGRQFGGPGQVDVATGFLTDTGKSVGDTITMTFGSKQVTARIVGQVFDTDNNGLAIITGWQTLAGADHALTADQYDVGLRLGTSAAAYAQALGGKFGPAYLVNTNGRDQGFPAGITLHRYVLPAMAAAANVGLPPSYLNVYGAGEMIALALAGLVIAVAGALLPAGWAAKMRAASALRTE